MPYKLTEHTGEMELELTAPTLEGLYEEAVIGMSWEMLPKAVFREEAPCTERREVEIEAADDEAQLVELLNETVYLADSDRFACYSAKVSFDKSGRLLCSLTGLVSDLAQTMVKAATYHRVKVEKIGEGWHARVVLDI